VSSSAQQGATDGSPPESAFLLESDETPERVLYDAAARFLDLQISTNDVLDNKAANVFSVGSTILPVTFGLLTLAPNRIPHWSVVMLFVALGAYIVLLLCAWRASAYRGLEYRPDIPHARGIQSELPGQRAFVVGGNGVYGVNNREPRCPGAKGSLDRRGQYSTLC
jgi:hypothetical protein